MVTLEISSNDERWMLLCHITPTNEKSLKGKMKIPIINISLQRYLSVNSQRHRRVSYTIQAGPIV